MTTEAVCRNKIWYESKKEAKRSAKRQENKGYILKAYKCDICDYFHLSKHFSAAYKKKARK